MKALVDLLTKQKLTIGSIESMTGGMFAEAITSVPGASKVFKGSIVSYSHLIKENVVGVSKTTIDSYGVVSKEVALEMAQKGRQILDVDLCVSVTGNAGPTSEPGFAKVGEIYIGISYKENNIVIKKLFEGSREKIRKNTLLAMQEEITILINS